jgi:hypothetical protein
VAQECGLICGYCVWRVAGQQPASALTGPDWSRTQDDSLPQVDFPVIANRILFSEQGSPLRSCHGGDYEECRLLGHRIPVRTSQETHYVSATVSSLLMLCKI